MGEGVVFLRQAPDCGVGSDQAVEVAVICKKNAVFQLRSTWGVLELVSTWCHFGGMQWLQCVPLERLWDFGQARW